MKQVLTTIYFDYDEDYPVVRLAPAGKRAVEEKHVAYWNVDGDLYRYSARVPAKVAARYRAAVTSYHAAAAALGQALDAYEKTLPPQKGPRWTGISSCA